MSVLPWIGFIVLVLLLLALDLGVLNRRPETVSTAQALRSTAAWVTLALGFNTVLIAHIMFDISFVVVTVKARLSGFDRHLEEAAMDLGANEWTTFWKVTFPLILPGVLAAAVLAFSLSIDDFVITNFVSGTTNTFHAGPCGRTKAMLLPSGEYVGVVSRALTVRRFRPLPSRFSV